MSKADKQLAQLRSIPVEMPYDTVARILERAGWTEFRVKGSHHIWTNVGCNPLTIAVHDGMVKRAAIREIAKQLSDE